MPCIRPDRERCPRLFLGCAILLEGSDFGERSCLLTQVSTHRPQLRVKHRLRDAAFIDAGDSPTNVGRLDGVPDLFSARSGNWIEAASREARWDDLLSSAMLCHVAV